MCLGRLSVFFLTQKQIQRLCFLGKFHFDLVDVRLPQLHLTSSTDPALDRLELPENYDSRMVLHESFSFLVFLYLLFGLCPGIMLVTIV